MIHQRTKNQRKKKKEKKDDRQTTRKDRRCYRDAKSYGVHRLTEDFNVIELVDLVLDGHEVMYKFFSRPNPHLAALETSSHRDS
jgi:hypothetical protein